jgi:general secretion pathway protein G
MLKIKVWNTDSFTLIELLIVVAIISILSAIAVPNFLEAQTRAKVSRVKADMASMTTALEVYAVDNNKYPYRRHPDWDSDKAPKVPLYDKKAEEMSVITTPISYMSILPEDVFDTTSKPPLNIIDYFDPEQTDNWARKCQPYDQDGVSLADLKHLWLLLSVGPDGYIGGPNEAKPGNYPPVPPFIPNRVMNWEYDPTNGTITFGNIYRLQGNADFTKTIRGK